MLSGFWSKSAEPPGRHDRIGSLGGRRVSDRHQAAEDRRVRTRRSAARRSIRSSPRRSARRRCCRRCSWRSRIRIPARAIAAKATAARIPTRSRGSTCRRRPTNRSSARARSRWSSTRRWCSSGCSAAARRRRSGRPGCGRTAAFSIRCSANSTGLKKELGAGDRRTVSQYTDEIREIERRIQLAAKASTDKVPVMDLPPGVPEQFDDHIKLHFDLTALAFQRTSRAWRRCSALAI